MIYALDPTGVSPNNKIVDEIKVVTPPNRVTDANFIIPNVTPFFKEGFSIYLGTRQLAEHVDYQFVFRHIAASSHFQREIFGGIMFFNKEFSGTVKLTYQCLGGDFQNSDPALIEGLTRSLGAVRWITFDQILGVPSSFPPAYHMHDIETDLVDMGDVVDVLEKINTELGSSSGSYGELSVRLSEHLSSTTAHSKAAVGLGEVQNFGIGTFSDVDNRVNNKYVTTDLLGGYIKHRLDNYRIDFSNYYTKEEVNSRVTGFITGDTLESTIGPIKETLTSLNTLTNQIQNTSITNNSVQKIVLDNQYSSVLTTVSSFKTPTGIDLTFKTKGIETTAGSRGATQTKTIKDKEPIKVSIDLSEYAKKTELPSSASSVERVTEVSGRQSPTNYQLTIDKQGSDGRTSSNLIIDLSSYAKSGDLTTIRSALETITNELEEIKNAPRGKVRTNVKKYRVEINTVPTQQNSSRYTQSVSLIVDDVPSKFSSADIEKMAENYTLPNILVSKWNQPGIRNIEVQNGLTMVSIPLPKNVTSLSQVEIEVDDGVNSLVLMDVPAQYRHLYTTFGSFSGRFNTFIHRNMVDENKGYLSLMIAGELIKSFTVYIPVGEPQDVLLDEEPESETERLANIPSPPVVGYSKYRIRVNHSNMTKQHWTQTTTVTANDIIYLTGKDNYVNMTTSDEVVRSPELEIGGQIANMITRIEIALPAFVENLNQVAIVFDDTEYLRGTSGTFNAAKLSYRDFEREPVTGVYVEQMPIYKLNRTTRKLIIEGRILNSLTILFRPEVVPPPKVDSLAVKPTTRPLSAGSTLDNSLRSADR